MKRRKEGKGEREKKKNINGVAEWRWSASVRIWNKRFQGRPNQSHKVGTNGNALEFETLRCGIIQLDYSPRCSLHSPVLCWKILAATPGYKKSIYGLVQQPSTILHTYANVDELKVREWNVME